MAYKQRKSTIDVTGMSISDIMDIDIQSFNKLSESDLRRYTSRLVSAGNKRIRKIESAGITTPAYRNLGTIKRFSTQVGKDLTGTQRLNKLRQEFSRVRNFLTSKTSTIRGQKAVVKAVKENLAKSTGLSMKEINKINLSKGFETFHKLQESGRIPSKGSDGSPKFRDFIIQQMAENPEISEESLMKMTEEHYNEIYEEQETKETIF